MFGKKSNLPLGILLCLFMLTACGQRAANLGASPNSAPAAAEASKEDNSIRAIGVHSDGRLLVKPAGKASAAPLGAPSCYGHESDLRWTGDYEAVWEAGAGGTSAKVMSFPAGFEIVQQKETPVAMDKFTTENTDIFAFVPRYADCHGLETYLFGVSGGNAFPISLEIKPGEVLSYISQLPHQPIRFTSGELIVTGGYGAGQDYIPVYHFRYDPKKRSMMLKSTDQVNPNEER